MAPAAVAALKRNPVSRWKRAVLIDPAVDAEYRQRTPKCTHCRDDRYTRFRYFNNKNAVLMRGNEPQARYACQSPTCLAANPGKSEVEFTLDGKTRKPYLKSSSNKKKRTSSNNSDDNLEEATTAAEGGSGRKKKRPRVLDPSSSSLPKLLSPPLYALGSSSFVVQEEQVALLPLVDLDIDIAAFDEDLSFLLYANNLQQEQAATATNTTTNIVNHPNLDLHGGGFDEFTFQDLLGSTSFDELQQVASMGDLPSALYLEQQQHDDDNQLQLQQSEPLQAWEQDSLEGLDDIVALVAEDYAEVNELNELVHMLEEELEEQLEDELGL